MEETEAKIMFYKKVFAFSIIADEPVNDNVEDKMFGYVRCTALSPGVEGKGR